MNAVSSPKLWHQTVRRHVFTRILGILREIDQSRGNVAALSQNSILDQRGRFMCDRQDAEDKPVLESKLEKVPFFYRIFPAVNCTELMKLLTCWDNLMNIYIYI
jgi:hypothetical protein